MNIIQTIYTLEPTEQFPEIFISKDARGYRYYLQVQYPYGIVSYVIFKSCIIGIFEYLSNQKTYEALKSVEYFDTYDACIEEIKTMTIEKIEELISTADNPHKLFAYKN